MDPHDPHWAWNLGDAGLAAEAAWAEPQSFLELTNVMVRFLTGEICESPSHLGPVDEETNEIVDYLLNFNRAGFMTVSSQPTHRSDWCDQIAFVEGFAPDWVARHVEDLALTGSLGVVVTPPGRVGTRRGYGDDMPCIDGHPSPRWIFDTWAPCLSRKAYVELRECSYVVAFDTNGRDPGRLWRNILEALVGSPAGWDRLFDVTPLRWS